MTKKNNKNSIIIVAIVAIVAIAGIAAFAISRDGEKMDDNMMSKSSNSQPANLVDTNSSEYKNYMTYSGEDYDRYFIATMIAHHQGAVDMANMALKNAQHQEIKDLATAIVTAQTAEISSMTSWQTAWGPERPNRRSRACNRVAARTPDRLDFRSRHGQDRRS